MDNSSLEARLQRQGAQGLHRLLGSAVEASSNGLIIADPNLPDTPIIYVNPAFERITGYSADEVLGYNCRFLQGTDKDQPDLEELRSAIREGRECRAVLRNYRKDGAQFWNELYISPVYGEGGRLESFVGVQNDITERYRAEEALREGEELLRLATQAGGVGIIRFDAGIGRISCSGSCAQIFGFAPGTVDSTREELLERVHPEDRERLRRAWDAALLEGTPYDVEHRLIQEGGGVRWVAEKGRVHRGANGDVEQVVGTVQDISARKESEEERDWFLERERRAREVAERSRRRMALMAAASQLLSSSLDYEETLDRITKLFVPGMADWCLLHLVADGVLNQATGAHADPTIEPLVEDLGNRQPNGEGSFVKDILRIGHSSLRPEVSGSSLEELSYDGESFELLQRLEPRSYMGVPLLAGGRTIGVLTLASSDPNRAYDSEDLALAEGLAHRCALALENARLYREHSYVTRTLQRGLLPQNLPEIPGVEVGVEYLPVGEDNEVGGDFYDLIDTNYDGWLCILGDVSGKGARAAAVTALIMYTLRAVAFQRDKPSAMFAALNEAMVRHHDTGPQFCTAVCARLEPEDAPGERVKLTLARAGHPPPLLLRDGSIEEVGEPGKAIGVFDELDLEDHHTHLVPGDILVLYTDGVTEARSPDGSFFGEERLRSLLDSCAGLDASATAQRIRDAVLEHKGGSPSDDVAILVMHVTGAG
jgi:PAS domain S-box-containing protein